MFISRRNEKWLLAKGAVEYGRRHYPLIIGLHILFLISLVVEYYLKGGEFKPAFFTVWLILTVTKVIIVAPLGKYWTTRIYRVPGDPLIKKGVYKYFAHPNYLIVLFEVPAIALIFNLYYTAIIFGVLNVIMLWVRVREENKALQ